MGGCDYGGPPSYFAPYRNPALKDGPEGEYLPDRLADECIAFLETPSEKPLFLCWWNYSVHYPIQAPQDLVEKYQQRQGVQRPAYYAMIEGMDRAIGKVLKHLETSGKADETLVIFTSDNGPTYNRLGGSDSTFFESAGVFKGLKGSVYEGGIRVPMIASWPGHIPAGKTSDEPAAFWDLMPTILHMTGHGDTVPEGLDGIDLSPTLLGHPQQHSHAYLYWEFPAYGGQQALRMGQWKAVRQQIFKEGLKTELYDLKADPSEQTNLATQYPAILAEMEKHMAEARSPSTLYPFKHLDPQ